jgi:predicted DNA-binding transcriptional regulator AlpA
LPKRYHLDRRVGAIVIAGEGNADDLLVTKQLAGWLGVSPQTLEIWRCKGDGPRYERLSPRMIRYKRSEVLKWLAGRECASTAEYRTVSKTTRRGRTNGRRT